MFYDIVQVIPNEDYTVYVYFEDGKIGKRSIASTFHHLCPSAIIVSYYTQSKKFSTRLF